MQFETLGWNDKLRIGDTVLTVLEIRNGPDVRRVRLGFVAPEEIAIDRHEVAEIKRLEREGDAP